METSASQSKHSRNATVTSFDPAPISQKENRAEDNVDLLRMIPFIALHLGCLAVIWVGWSWTAIIVAVSLYLTRMFAITAFYHRYFSHRTFKTSRLGQFVFAILGATAVQKGALWWAAHHRDHYRYSDKDGDIHSPRRQGLYWSHVGWITSSVNYRTKLENVKDLDKFPELRFLDRFDLLVPLLLALCLFAVGQLLQTTSPQLGTSGPQLLIWGFFISTVALSHGTFTINSLGVCAAESLTATCSSS